jgi:preprotein translocase subunit SecG
MTLFITMTHIFLCFFLILIILLQPGKDSADIFGGGGQSGNKMYGARSQSNPLGRATTLVAILFMCTSITLAFRSSEEANAKSDAAQDAIEIDRLRAENMKMTFEVPKLRLLTPEELYDQPPNFDFNKPNLDFFDPIPDQNPSLNPEDISVPTPSKNEENPIDNP